MRVTEEHSILSVHLWNVGVLKLLHIDRVITQHDVVAEYGKEY